MDESCENDWNGATGSDPDTLIRCLRRNAATSSSVFNSTSFCSFIERSGFSCFGFGWSVMGWSCVGVFVSSDAKKSMDGNDVTDPLWIAFAFFAF